MAISLTKFNHSRTRTDLPDIRPGHVVKVHQKIVETKKSGKKEETKERIQVFEGLVIGKKGGNNINATITVRKISDSIGVEKIFPIYAPTIEKIELIKKTKAKRAKLNYMRKRVGKATRPKGELIKSEEGKPAETNKNSELKKETDSKADKKTEEKSEDAIKRTDREVKNEKKEEGPKEKTENGKKEDSSAKEKPREEKKE